MTTLRLLALADDLTGALEAGARFADAIVTLKPVGGAFRGVMVVDTESRHLAPDVAAFRLLSAMEGVEAEILYKKTDSTLRGNIGAEFKALLGAYPDSDMYYVPAYPEMGRTVRKGVLHVDGKPVHKTSFARDPLNPVTESRIEKVLAAQGCDLERVRIFDGETQEDVLAGAQAALAGGTPVLVAGPAALAGAIARIIGLEPEAPETWPAVRDCVVINGSAHPASALQVETARKHGIPWAFDRLAGPHDTLIIFGGDTARGVLHRLGDPVLRPLGEILPGVPVSLFEQDGRQRVLVSKAGGYGAPDLLVRLYERLCQTEKEAWNCSASPSATPAGSARKSS
ncbi:four-carbon acid sugar kinase family protein [uncultured Paludibaculum sp.]|uniref:four-carbon acid sugar kinase family protein n=1 Tax=uncultured Paludibaculum sp. TaxID=1765020 RepID=UPI002AABDFB6|nr:four-carbon acid sugar kinase family protein [uncultured Paludibaculum sp.]